MLAAIAGCGGRTLADSDTSSTGSTSGAVVTSDDSGVVTSTGEETTSTTTTTTGADETTHGTTGTSTGDAPPACEPAPARVEVTLEVAGSLAHDPSSPHQSGAACVVDTIDAPGASTTVGLDCVDDVDGNSSGVMVTYSTPVPVAIDLVPGGAVQLDVFSWSLYWLQEYVVLRDAEGEVVLAWVTGEGPPGRPSTVVSPSDDFYAPLELGLAYPCEAECDDEQDTEDCGCPRRFAVTFALGDDTTSVMDANSGMLGNLMLFVENAHDDVGGTGESCGLHEPIRWVEALAIRSQ